MGLENANFIEELDPLNPVSADPKAQGDDHIRMIKRSVQGNFPALGLEPVTSNAAYLSGAYDIGRIATFPLPPVGVGMVWIKCGGQPIVRADFPDLFAYLGVAYGPGDGAATFNVPDYRGKFLRGQDEGAAVDPDAAARTDRGDGTVGDNVGTQQPFSNASHSHVATQAAHSHTVPTAEENSKGGPINAGSSRATESNPATSAVTPVITVNVDGASVEARPVNINVRHYIFSGRFA